jgi:hypothetical protein
MKYLVLAAAVLAYLAGMAVIICGLSRFVAAIVHDVYGSSGVTWTSEATLWFIAALIIGCSVLKIAVTFSKWRRPTVLFFNPSS